MVSYGWYGKMSSPLSQRVIDVLSQNEEKKILLIRSGGIERCWAYYDELSKETPSLDLIPEYYRNMAKDKFKFWFRIIKFESAPKNIVSKCTIVSSGNPLGEASKHSLNPHFVIDIQD